MSQIAQKPHTWQTSSPQPPSINEQGEGAHKAVAEWLKIYDRRVRDSMDYGTFQLYQFTDNGLTTAPRSAVKSGFAFTTDVDMHALCMASEHRKWTISRYRLSKSDCENLAKECARHHRDYFGGGWVKEMGMSEALAREFLGPEPRFNYKVDEVPTRLNKINATYWNNPDAGEFLPDSNFWAIKVRKWPVWQRADNDPHSSATVFESNWMCTTNKENARKWLHRGTDHGIEVVEYFFEDVNLFIQLLKTANQNKHWFGGVMKFVQIPEGEDNDEGLIPGFSGESQNFTYWHSQSVVEGYKLVGEHISVEEVETRLNTQAHWRRMLE